MKYDTEIQYSVPIHGSNYKIFKAEIWNIS